MRTSSRFLLFAIPLLLLTVALPARALGPDLYFGYSRLSANTLNPNTPALNGWQAAANFGFLPFIGVEADVAHYGIGGDSNVPHSTTFMVGPRVTVGAAGVHVFAHGLFGGEHSSLPGTTTTVGNFFDQNAFTVAAGGGLDVKLIPLLAWRFTGDYIQAPTRSNTSGHARFGTGLVLRF